MNEVNPSDRGVDEWASRHRLVYLIDRSDAFLSCFRSNRWLARNVSRTGDDWPKVPFIGITFHYGAGLWALRDIAGHGLPVSFLSTRFDAATFGGTKAAYRGALWRMRLVASSGQAPVIYTGGSKQAIRKALSQGVSVIGLIDVPPGQTSGFVSVSFLGKVARFPVGLVALSHELGVPLVSFVMGIDPVSGQRRLIIRRIPLATDEKQMCEIVALLEDAIQMDSAAWHRWSDLPAFYRHT